MQSENHYLIIDQWLKARTHRSGQTPTNRLYQDYICFCNNEGTQTIPPIQVFGMVLSYLKGIPRQRVKGGTLIQLSLKPTDPTPKTGRRSASVKFGRRLGSR